MIRDTPKLFLTHTGNLIPPSDRACDKIITRENSDSRNHEKNKIFEPKIQNLGFFLRG